LPTLFVWLVNHVAGLAEQLALDVHPTISVTKFASASADDSELINFVDQNGDLFEIQECAATAPGFKIASTTRRVSA
jgi:hypothetical protein